MTFVSGMPQLAIFLPHAFVEIRGQLHRQVDDANELEDIRQIAEPMRSAHPRRELELDELVER